MGVEFTQSGNDIIVREDESEIDFEELQREIEELRKRMTPEEREEERQHLAEEYRDVN